VTIFPVVHVPVPNAQTGVGAFNYFVPIINASIDDIDLVRDTLAIIFIYAHTATTTILQQLLCQTRSCRQCRVDC
jgi:hypothetical protein